MLIVFLKPNLKRKKSTIDCIWNWVDFKDCFEKLVYQRVIVKNNKFDKRFTKYTKILYFINDRLW